MLLLRSQIRKSSRANFLPRYSSTSTQEIVDKWKNELLSSAQPTMKDKADLHRLSQLRRTIPFRSTSGSKPLPLMNGDALPEGHHLVLFQPETDHADLGADGTSTDLNAPEPFVRRMWAGGVISWFPDVPKLVIGQEIIQTLKVGSVELKVGMVFVNQVRELRAAGSSEVAVEELRTYVFRQSEPSKKSSNVKVVWSPPASPDFSSIIMPTSPLLFRFSALTFNGHKIHYDQVFARESEGHPDVVVHGPLTALLLIENTVDFLTKNGGKRLIKFDYRAISPMYVDRMISFAGAWKDETMGQMDIWSCQDGKVTMRATGVVI